jgi:hypothetical protein
MRGHLRINHQITDNTWRCLDIYGLHHTNMIYDGKAVELSAVTELSNTKESGFIIPIHEEVFRSVSLMASAQMSTASAYLLINCYKVVETPWYATGIFKIFIIIIIIIIAIMTGYVSAEGIGLLGANAAVGAALGATGITATIVGVVANTLAAVILAKVVMIAATAMFGEKVGAIIGSIVAFIAVSYGVSLQGSTSTIFSADSWMKAEVLLSMTMSVSNGISGFLQASIQDIVKKTETLIKDYTQELQDISQKYIEMFGMGSIGLDPLRDTDLRNPNGIVPELPSSFFQRTLMVGSDIADLTQYGISGFSELTLTPRLLI